jgi:hypothetical protein
MKRILQIDGKGKVKRLYKGGQIFDIESLLCHFSLSFVNNTGSE